MMRLFNFIKRKIKNFKIFKIFKIKVIIIIILISSFSYCERTKVCLCIIGKKENLYAKEYINYYKKLGYKHIYLYDNNDINDERFEDVLQKEIKYNFVSILNYRGYRGLQNKPQINAYYDCYEKNNKNYNWLSFFDFDEFLELKEKNIKIGKYLDNIRFQYCDNIKINWLFYSDNDLIHYDNRPIYKRFTLPVYDNGGNIHIKSTIRGNLKYNYWNNTKNPHTSLNNFTSCSSSGNIINYYSPFNKPPDYKFAILKHYYSKTIEEYCKKIKRGKADKNPYYNKNEIKIKLKQFFTLNKKTKEKLDIIYEEFNINFT